MLAELFSTLPVGVQLRVDRYFQNAAIPPSLITKTDLVLALLRIDDPEAREAAERISGVPIKVLPPGMPPWPPLPVGKRPRKILIRREPNPCLPTTDAFQRYRRLKVGATRDQLMTLGITSRDLNDWSRRGVIEFGEV